MKSARLLAALLLAALGLSCSENKSIVVVAVYSGDVPVSGVAQLRVQAVNGQLGEYSEVLYYPEKPRAETALLELSKAQPVTFSLTFRSMFKGTVKFKIDALDGAQAILASGDSSPEQLGSGQITYANVRVVPPCDPMKPALTCGERQNCAFVCDAQKQAETVCLASGLTNPGDACGDLSDCAPGSECFEFSCAGSPVKTCRKFCSTDADCGAGAACIALTPCSGSARKANICSRPCDPTGSATNGCAAGLRCFIYAGEVTDCACSPATRTGSMGQTCASDEACQPGLTCVDFGGQKTCRPLCTIKNSVCPGGSSCTQVDSSVYKTYGVCL
jgi:hypothetical protein